MVKKIIINKDFIMRDDLRDWIFKEDKEGRYRERIIDEIEKFGVMNWFKAKKYPTDEESIWKNRYCGSTTTLKEQIHNFENIEHRGVETLETQGYYLWENYMPIDIWNDKELRDDCREGTKEYQDRMIEEAKSDKEWAKKDKAKARKEEREEANKKQQTLFQK